MADLAIPEALKYGVSEMRVRKNRISVLPLASDTCPSTTGVIRFRLPERAILDLGSLSLNFTSTISGLTSDATNWASAIFPAAYKYWRQVRFYVNGQIVSGQQSQHYNQLYSFLARNTVGEDLVRAKMLQGWISDMVQSDAIADLSGNPGATSRSMFQVCDDFLGLARGNGGSTFLDTSLFGGSVEIELTADDKSILQVAVNGTGSSTAIDWSLSSCRMECDVYQVPALYAQLLSVRLQSPEPIKIAFQNFNTVIQQINGSNRLQVNSGCVDMLGFVPLSATYTTRADLANNVLQPPKFRYNSGVSVANEGTITVSVQVGPNSYPQSGAITHGLLLADYCENAFHKGSVASNNMLFHGITLNTTPVYNYASFMANNFGFVVPFGMSEGWASKQLTGLDTANQNVDMVINTSGISTSLYMLIFSLNTSVLKYNTRTSNVEVDL